MVNQSTTDLSAKDETETIPQIPVAQTSCDWWTRVPSEGAAYFDSGRIAPLSRLRSDVLANALLIMDGRPILEDIQETVATECPMHSEAMTVPDQPEVSEKEAPQPTDEFEPFAESPDLEPFLERRNLPRHSGNASVRVVRIPGDTSLTSQQKNWELHGTSLRGELTEISLRSVVCLLGEPFSPGDAVYVRLTNPRTHRTLDVPGEVERVRFISGDDRWKVVYALKRSLTLSELQHYAFASEQLLSVSEMEDRNPAYIESNSPT